MPPGGELGSMAVRLLVVATVAAGLLLAGCSGTHPVSTLLLRNDSPNSATVEVETPGQFPFGAEHASFELPPWHAGLCSYAGWGLMALPVSASISGPAIDSASIKNASPAGADVLIVVVGATGKVAFRIAPEPVQSTPCEAYRPVG